MQQAAFVNKTVVDARHSKDYLRLIWASRGAASKIILYAVAGFGLCYAVYQLVAEGGAALPYALAMAALALLAFCLAQWGYLLRVPGYMASVRRLWGEEIPEKEVFFYPDKIYQKSRLGELTLEYKQITAYYQSRLTLVLMFGKGALILDANGFTEGTLADFRQFLAKKCPALPRRRVK